MVQIKNIIKVLFNKTIKRINYLNVNITTFFYNINEKISKDTQSRTEQILKSTLEQILKVPDFWIERFSYQKTCEFPQNRCIHL